MKFSPPHADSLLSMTRRDAMGCLAGAAAGLTSCARENPDWWTWNGLLFGTTGSVGFLLPDGASAPELLPACEAEIRRLEAIFTLYEEDSPLRQLNRDGVLTNPPPELLKALEISGEVHRLSNGAFDVTVQPLWDLYKQHFANHPDDRKGPPEEEVIRAREQVGFEKLEFDADAIRLQQVGMGVTLNGIAQGFVADAMAEFLSARGVEHALIHLGEYRAISGRPDGKPWALDIVGTEGESLETVEIQDRGLATSSASGWVFQEETGLHHIFHPGEDRFASLNRVVSVEAEQAAVADAIATAGVVMSIEELMAMERRLSGMRLWVFDRS